MHKRPEFPTELNMPLGIVTEAGDIKYKVPKTEAEVLAMLHLCLIHMDVLHDHMKQIHERAKAAGYMKEDTDAVRPREDEPGTGSPDRPLE